MRSAYGPRLTAEPVLGFIPKERAVRRRAPGHARDRVTLRLVLADDSVLLREGIARLLVEAGFEVVAQAGDADELLEAVRRHRPDVAIVDIRMPPTHTDEGLRAAEAIRAEHGTAVGILVLSQYVETTFAHAPRGRRGGRRRLPAQGSGRGPRRLRDAIRRIARGGSVIDPEVVAQLVGRRRARVPLDDLTEREREVLALMAEGRSNQAICDRAVPGAARPSRRTSPTSSRSSSCCPPRTTIGGCSPCSPTCAAERSALRRRRRNPGATLTNDIDPRPAASVISRWATRAPAEEDRRRRCRRSEAHHPM